MTPLEQIRERAEKLKDYREAIDHPNDLLNCCQDITRLIKAHRIMLDALMHYKALEEMGNVDHDHLAEQFIEQAYKILEGEL